MRASRDLTQRRMGVTKTGKKSYNGHRTSTLSNNQSQQPLLALYCTRQDNVVLKMLGCDWLQISLNIEALVRFGETELISSRIESKFEIFFLRGKFSR